MVWRFSHDWETLPIRLVFHQSGTIFWRVIRCEAPWEAPSMGWSTRHNHDRSTAQHNTGHLRLTHSHTHQMKTGTELSERGAGLEGERETEIAWTFSGGPPKTRAPILSCQANGNVSEERREERGGEARPQPKTTNNAPDFDVTSVGPDRTALSYCNRFISSAETLRVQFVVRLEENEIINFPLPPPEPPTR